MSQRPYLPAGRKVGAEVRRNWILSSDALLTGQYHSNRRFNSQLLELFFFCHLEKKIMLQNTLLLQHSWQHIVCVSFKNMVFSLLIVPDMHVWLL